MQVLLLLFSAIFLAIIFYGYFNLFSRSGYFVASIIAAILALFAWYLARVIGTSPGGIRKYWFLFIPLLVVSAAGVYNSLMVYLEGSRILSDTVAEAQGTFDQLGAAAEQGLAESGATVHLNKVNSLSEALYSEIRNPQNCGQGPEARRIIAELQRELPTFTPLSSKGIDCARNEEVIADYRERIRGLVARAEWNNPVLNQVAERSDIARGELEQLRAKTTNEYTPLALRSSLSALEAHDSNYRDLRLRLSKHVEAKDIPEDLHLSEVQSLGNAFKLPALFLERLDRPATWAYLLVAVFFDLLMVFLFQLVSSNHVRRPSKSNLLSGAW
jgi:hypothetical protein